MGFNSQVRFSSSVQVLPEGTVADELACGQARLVFPASGMLLVSSEQGHWVVSPTRAIWLAAGVRHHVRALGQVRLKTFISLDPGAELPGQTCVLHVTPLLLEIMRSLTRAAPDELQSRKALLLGELLLEKIIHRVPAPIELPSPRDPRLATICGHIQLHPDDATTLAQFAADMACSERTLHRLFIQETGMSFTVWRHHAKLHRALGWLDEGRSILDIALDLGYQNQGAFSAMFRKYFGIAPTQYARRPAAEAEPA